MKKVLDPRKIRVGHKVRILIPKFLDRVGYELTYPDVFAQLCKHDESHHLFTTKCFTNLNGLKDMAVIKLINEFICQLNGCAMKHEIIFGKDLADSLANTITHKMAYQIMGKRINSGDQQRKKFETENIDMKGHVVKIEGKRTAKVGERVAPQYYEDDSYYGDDGGDYDPGGLAGEKTINILKIELNVYNRSFREIDRDYTERVIDKQTVESRRWFKKYYQFLSADQKIDIFQMYPELSSSCKKDAYKHLLHDYEECKKKKDEDDVAIGTPFNIFYKDARHDLEQAERVANKVW